jgi:hypothetical protein
MAPSKGK